MTTNSWWHSLYWHVCAGHKELVKNSLSLGRICNKIKSLHGLCVKFSISILPSVPTQTFCYTMHHMPKNYCSQHMIWKSVHLISSQSFSDSYLNVLVNMGTSGFFVFTCFLFKFIVFAEVNCLYQNKNKKTFLSVPRNVFTNWSDQ